jgi:hypothetical protein
MKRVLVVLGILARAAHADGIDLVTPKYAKGGQALAAERFPLKANAAPGRLGARYLRVAQDMFCTEGKAQVVLFDARDGKRIETTLPCPTEDGLQLARYAPDAHVIGWFYEKRTDANPFTYDKDKQAYLDHEVYDTAFEGCYVEQDLRSGKLGAPLVVFRSAGYDSLYQATKVELASDDRSLDFFFHEHRRSRRPNTRAVRLDVVDRRVSTLFERTAATYLDIYANPSHTWIVLTGWLDKFDTEFDPGGSVFYSIPDHVEFQAKTTGTVHAITFDDAHHLAYLGGPTHADVWRVDLAKQKIDEHLTGLGLVNNILLRPDGQRIAILTSYGEYFTTNAKLDHTTRHPYKPLLDTDAPYPWQHAMVSSVDGLYAVYTSAADKSAAVLTWR